MGMENYKPQQTMEGAYPGYTNKKSFIPNPQQAEATLFWEAVKLKKSLEKDLAKFEEGLAKILLKILLS